MNMVQFNFSVNFLILFFIFVLSIQYNKHVSQHFHHCRFEIFHIRNHMDFMYFSYTSLQEKPSDQRNGKKKPKSAFETLSFIFLYNNNHNNNNNRSKKRFRENGKIIQIYNSYICASAMYTLNVHA